MDSETLIAPMSKGSIPGLRVCIWLLSGWLLPELSGAAASMIPPDIIPAMWLWVCRAQLLGYTSRGATRDG